MRVGPDGKPQIREFGNTPGGCRDDSCKIERKDKDAPMSIGGREPLTDVMETEKHVAVTVELPGVEKEDIVLDATEKTLTIKVNTEDRRFYKEVDLPCNVKPDTAKASYKNGVLDITLERVEMQDKERKRIVVD
jgi:HSP20 family protein